jgi:hypothetical protein
MQSRWVLIFLFIFSAEGVPAAAGNDARPHSLEQLHFSAEDPGVKVPAIVPGDVLAILQEDEMVRAAVEDERPPAKKAPTSWFSASEIHLRSADEVDFIVMAEGPLGGANVTTFWVFVFTAEGYQLALTAPAHDLIVENQRLKGYRNIELTSMTAVQISTVLLRFDGKRYTEYRSKSEPIR